MARKKNNMVWWIVGAIIVIIVGFFLVTRHAAPPVKVITDPSTLPGIQMGDAPWTPNIADLRARLTAIGLPALAQEGTVLHIHQHLDIFVDGAPVAIPAGIGINELAGFISPIHVHDTTGIVHVESPVVQTFTLGQFFDIWGVRLTAQCIGGYCTSGDKTLKLFVNGSPYAGDPRQLALQSHEEIVITYGTDAEMPKTIPSSFVFPAGY